MSDPLENPWEPGGRQGSRWDAGEAGSTPALATPAVEGMDQPPVPASDQGAGPLHIELPPPNGIDQKNNRKWCWAAAFASFHEQFSPSHPLEYYLDRFRGWRDKDSGGSFVLDDGSLRPTREVWRQATAALGCDACDFHLPPHGMKDSRLGPQAIHDILAKHPADGSGYFLLAELDGSYNHVFVGYGLLDLPFYKDSWWPFWQVMDPDGGRLGKKAPVGRSPGYERWDWDGARKDVGGSSQFWIAYRKYGRPPKTDIAPGNGS